MARHWFEDKQMKMIEKDAGLKGKAEFTVGSGNQRRDNDILVNLTNNTIQIEIKWLETKTKAGNIIIKFRDWQHLEEQAGAFNIPIVVNGHSKLELASMRPSDLYALFTILESQCEKIASLEAEVAMLRQELEASDAD